MKKFKQLLSLMLVACMLLSVMPMTAFAADTVITVGPSGCDFTTIGAALDSLDSGTSRVIIEIQPGNYEEQLYIDRANVTLRNASSSPSIALTNKGVDIDANAVRITHYYGHGYNYYSMGSDYLYDEALLATNKENGKASVTNPGAGSATHWNASVIIAANGFIAEDIIFENSFNQYVSAKAANDGIVDNGSAKEGSTARADLSQGSTAVQDKAYVERAAALAIAKNVDQAYFDHCKIVGRQDTLYGGKGATAAFYDCEIYGACDYIFGGMTAVFAKCELVFNTSDSSNDRGYITAPQQESGRGYLMYNCHITSTTPGVDTASSYASKPGYFGRPWAASTGEAVFYNTVIDATCSKWSSQSASLIYPAGWLDTLNGESALCGEYGTYEMSGVDNASSRASWAQVFTAEKLADGTAISVSSYLGSWNPFSGEDMTITMPDGTVTDPENTEPTSGSTTVPAGSYVHNFTQSGTSSSFYTITGSLSTSKGSTTYNGETLTQCLKMESSTTITFNAPESGTLTLVFGGTTSADGKSVKIDGVKQTISGETITVDVAAGDHTVTKGESINLFYMVYTSDSAAGGETEATTAPTEAHSHSYTSSVTTAATCGAAGVMTYTCSCGDSYTEAIAATGSHSYSNGVCTVCGAADPSYVAPTDPTEPSVTAGTYAHNFTENGTSSSFYTITGSLSTSKGSTTYNGETLTQCLKMESSTTITFNAPADGTLTLVFGGTTSADGSTVKIDGEKQTISGETITVDVTAGDHTVTKGDSINLFYMVYTANSTGEEHSHSYAPVVTAPTCTEQGYTTYTCSCGDSYVSDYAAATGHSYESVTVDATCTEDGSITYTCACGDTYSEPIPAAGHSYTAVVTAPTCTAQGYTTYTCPACGDSYAADYVSAAGHSYETSVTAPGCETQGYTTHTCPACGDSYIDSYTDALRHSYNAGGICVNCGEEDPNALPPLYLFTIAGNSMSVGNDLSMYFFVERADVADGSYYMQITKTYADGREDVVKTIPMSSWLASGDYYLVAFNGIAAKEMGDNVIATVCNADGTAASYTMVTSVVDYAMTKLNEGGNSAQLNTLLADMLNYGAAAQAEFSYDTENPANAMMSEEQKGYATAQFDMSTLNVTAVDGAAGMGATMSLKSSIVLNVFLDPAQVTTDMTAKISYTNHNSRAVSYEIAGSKFTQLGSYYLYLNVDTLAASDIETVVTVEIYDGETLVSTSQYNMAGYCANNANKDIAVSLAKFCTSAYAYFHP